MNNIPPSRIKIIQYMHGDLPYFPLSERINRRYCEMHGYQYVVRRDPPRKDRHINWHKVPMILDEISHCDYMIYVDADAFFYGDGFTVENHLLPRMGNHEIMMAADITHEGWRWNPDKPNAGVIVMKTTPEVLRFMEYWNASSEIAVNLRWEWPLEQRALWECVLPMFPDFLRVEPDYYLFQGHYGLFIRHLMITPNEERVRQMKDFCRLRGIEIENIPPQNSFIHHTSRS